MSEIKQARTDLGLTQADAARKAGVSLATWRRAEREGEDQVGADSLKAIKGVVAKVSDRPSDSELSTQVALYNMAFTKTELTPVTAWAMALVCGSYSDEDAYLRPVLSGEMQPNDALPFMYLPDAVLIRVGTNPQWLACFQQAYRNVAAQLDKGKEPAPRTIAEEWAIWCALGPLHDEEVEALIKEEEGGGEFALGLNVREGDHEIEPGELRFELLGRAETVWDFGAGNPVRDFTEEHCGYVRTQDGGMVLAPTHPYRWFEWKR